MKFDAIVVVDDDDPPITTHRTSVTGLPDIAIDLGTRGPSLSIYLTRARAERLRDSLTRTLEGQS